jgi:predicted unusual protein kinase regulating ubiquinone biosynthesis (AarF/ABC1/UbiB family)
MADRKKPKTLKNIKSGFFLRSLSLAKLTVGAGASLATQKVTNILKNKSERNQAWLQFLTSQAQNFSEEVGQLKGSIMKVGQMLSVIGEHFLPPEVNQYLKTLQNDTAPMEWSRIKSILEKQLGFELLSELEIETEALASASLGQVHRGRIKKTGHSIILKIQYPGVDKAINSDILAVKRFLNLMKVFPIEGSLDALMDEMKEMLVQEMDYEHEVKLMEKYRELLKNDSRYIIPQYYARYSSKKIIAMSFERGLKADDPLVQSLSQERRNNLAKNFLELYFKELFKWHFIQTDPHLGNYRLRLDPTGNDQIVLFDFGATKAFSREFLSDYKQLIKSLILQDEKFETICLKLDFIKAKDDPNLVALFKKLSLETVEPFNSEIYDWKNSNLPQRITDAAIKMVRQYPLRTPPRELLFLNRKTAGVFIFLSVLGAKIESRALLLNYLNETEN